MSIGMDRGIRTVVALVALGCAALFGFARSETAQGSGGGDCKFACVIIVEVDGLEPKDVTPSATPVMWALAHPDLPGAQLAQGQGRSGYMWQAARGVMGAGTAPAAASLLTGGYAEQTDVPADEFQNKDGHQWIGDPASSIATQAKTLFSLVGGDNGEGAPTAAYLGDPGLKWTLNIDPQGRSDVTKWSYPGSKDGKITGDPQLCPIPRTRPEGQGDAPSNTNECDADDAQVVQQAAAGYTGSDQIAFEYVHLAELGRIKQLYGDVDQQGQAQPPAVADALKATDAALGAFVGQVSQSDSAKWAKTTMFVVGNHGYESTPIAQRVPDPRAGQDTTVDPNSDLAAYVSAWTNSNTDGHATLVPQGTLATVYADSRAAGHLKEMRQAILDVNATTLCQGACISEVLYVHDPPPDTPADQTVAGKHPSWHIDPVGIQDANRGQRTGSGGDLLVVMAPGWAAGRATYVPDPSDPLTPVAATNPYLASSGGPRDRAIAAFVNGPSGTIKQKPFNEDNGRAPVTTGVDDGRAQADPAFSQVDPIGISAANASPEDDANGTGHERQLETPDVALTAASLLHVSVEAPQEGPDTRILTEACPTCITFEPANDVVGTPDPPPEQPPEPPPPPPPPPPPVEPPPIEIEQPPPPEAFNFHGLIRNLKARVTDDKGNPVSKAKPGADLSYIQLTADFGKPQAQVSLTFYRNAKAGTGQSAKRRKGTRNKLKAVVHFKPFKVQRGPAKIKLQVPARFAPDHVGVIVQEVREVKTPPKERLGGNGSSGEQTNFEGFGPKDGGIVAIADSNKLHTKARATKGKKRGR
jgi:hypothetical protein